MHKSFVITLIALQVFALRTQAADLTSTEKTFLTSCLTEYIDLIDKNSVAVATKRRQIEKSIEQLKRRCLSKNFRKQWQKTIEATNGDPLLNVQDNPESWKTDVRIEDFDSKTNHVKFIFGKPDEEFCLILGLKKIGSSGHYQIDSSSVCAKK